MIINEDNRNKLVSRSKTAQRERDGQTRYQKRVKIGVPSTVNDFNNIDMNNLFKADILTIKIPVKGETDNYTVTIKFGSFLEILREEVKRFNVLDLRVVIKSLTRAFNEKDIYVRCSCEDFYYRFGYYATVNNILAGDPQLIPSKETNPNDNLGPACKHVLKVLSLSTWVIKLSSVIFNYINYMEKYREDLFARLIYPKVYGKKYEEPTQIGILDKEDELDTDADEIDISNKYARTKNLFQPGNPDRFTPRTTLKGQEEIEGEQ